jgi:CxxC motif-containing protein (DUF1111 family)
MSSRSNRRGALRAAAWTLSVALTAAPATRAQDVAAATPIANRARPDPSIVEASGADPFGLPSPAFDAVERRAFAVGNAFFRRAWTPKAAGPRTLDGLGPLFNSRSCGGCHLRDARGRVPTDDDPFAEGLVLKIAVRGADGRFTPHPVYGTQVQDRAVDGAPPEGRVVVERSIRRGTYGDGTPYELEVPRYRVDDPGYGPLGAGAVFGPRLAQQLVGLALLEAVSDETLLALEDQDDRDQDGVSGRARRVVDSRGRATIGRFGWKATAPTIEEQTAGAFLHDMGVTSTLRRDEATTPAQRDRLGFDASDEVDVDAHVLGRVAFYVRGLATPARRDAEADATRRGEERFVAFGCAACHKTELRTGDDAFHPAYRGAAFAAYTDLLLHDMGPALADGFDDDGATRYEWRTPPLLGLGLLPKAAGPPRLLHDGRARGFSEAILWHGGEGARARESFRLAPAEARADLLLFLESL